MKKNVLLNCLNFFQIFRGSLTRDTVAQKEKFRFLKLRNYATLSLVCCSIEIKKKEEVKRI